MEPSRSWKCYFFFICYGVLLSRSATKEIAGFLDEIRRNNDIYKGDYATTCLGADPELDEFMVSRALQTHLLLLSALVLHRSFLERANNELFVELLNAQTLGFEYYDSYSGRSDAFWLFFLSNFET